MAFQDEDIHTLTRLGLNLSQARVYLALVQSETSTIRKLSEVSRVAREHVYRTLGTLQKLGLAQEIVTKPARFKATPMNDVVSILLHRRINETSELQEKTRELVQRFIEKKTKTTRQEEEAQFVLIPKDAIVHKRKNIFETAQKSIDIVTTFKRFAQALSTHARDYKKALNRGVIVRQIAEIPKDESQWVQITETTRVFRKYPSFQVKYFRAPITTVVALVDRKEVLIFTVPSLELEESPALSSTNKSLIELSQHYFEMMWLTAMEEIPKEP